MASWGVKQNFSIIILLTVLFVACSGKEELPEDILSNQEMTHVMIQVHVLESKVSRLGIPRDSSVKVYRHLEKELFTNVGIDSADYYRSFEYYSMNPEAFTTIYEAVVDSLMEMESKEKLRAELMEKERREADSVKRLGGTLKIDTVKQELLKERSRPALDRMEKLDKPDKIKVDAKQPE